MFKSLATHIARVAGHPYAFLGALAIIVAWAASGPLFGFSDTWQLVVNTGTTIVTFLMGFTIQYSQNRDGRALQLKLDEVLRSLDQARSEFVGLDKKADDVIEAIEAGCDEDGPGQLQAAGGAPSRT